MHVIFIQYPYFAFSRVQRWSVLQTLMSILSLGSRRSFIYRLRRFRTLPVREFRGERLRTPLLTHLCPRQPRPHHPRLPQTPVVCMSDLRQKGREFRMVAIQPHHVENSHSIDGNIVSVFCAVEQGRGQRQKREEDGCDESSCYLRCIS